MLKLLQAGIIYPISRSPWVSPTQVVPNKSGITVVQKEKREEIKGKKKGKNIEKDGYDVNVQRELQRIVIKEELMKKHMPPPFLQVLYGKIIQTKSQVRDASFIWDSGKLNQDQIF